MDWHAWHDAYDAPDSPLTQRLATIRQRIAIALDDLPPGPIRVLSVCAGQGRDLLGALEGHPRRHDVTARLVELDPRNVASIRDQAAARQLTGIEAVVGDAADTGRYTDFGPADLLLVCGLLGNVTDPDIERMTGYCARLCATGGTLIWTRDHRAPDRVPWICRLLEDRGFTRVWLNDPAARQGVGVHRFTGTPTPLVAGETMFTFVGFDVLARAAGEPTA